MAITNPYLGGMMNISDTYDQQQRYFMQRERLEEDQRRALIEAMRNQRQSGGQDPKPAPKVPAPKTPDKRLLLL